MKNRLAKRVLSFFLVLSMVFGSIPGMSMTAFAAEGGITSSGLDTSNLTFERWDEIFGDAAITSAIVDRLTYKAYLIDMEGDSYRLRETLRSNGTDFETVTK